MNYFTHETIKSRRSRLTEKLNPHLKNNEALIFFSGEPQQKPGGLDQTYPFLPLPSYYWVSGSRRPLGMTVYSPQSGWVDYFNPASDVEKLWEGSSDYFIPENFKPLSQFDEDIAHSHFQYIYFIGTPAQSFFTILNYPERLAKQADQNFLFNVLVDQCRRHKDAAEIQLISQCAAIAARGYEKFKAAIKPGISERELQIIYEAEVQLQGADKLPYETIIGAGENSAVLHAIPTQKKLAANELVLIDAGVDLQDYCVDITRVFCSSGVMNTQQQGLYNTVKKAQTEAIALCKPGTSWPDVHTLTAKIIAEGLKSFGILKTNVNDCLESGAIALFYPHGVGHLVGLRVRDTGCIENKTPKKYCGANLRVDLVLQENYLITVEPGCYFIRNMIENESYKKQYSDFYNWSELEKWKSIGGVRLEDDILITQNEPKNLTALIEK